MSEVENQEGQKTVVAFITGLLIGGLLVWVFSSSPEKTVTQDATSDTTTEESTESAVTPSTSDSEASKGDTTVSAPKETTAPVAETGSLKVSNQKAGDTVALGMVTFPGEGGWVVVRDYANGTAGKVLGAARYSVSEGLAPTSVGLLRKTVAGSTYQVLFYTESGDKKFSSQDDKPVEAGAVTFKAE